MAESSDGDNRDKGKGIVAKSPDPDILVSHIHTDTLPATKLYLLAKLTVTKTFNPKAFMSLMINLWSVRKNHITYCRKIKSLALLVLRPYRPAPPWFPSQHHHQPHQPYLHQPPFHLNQPWRLNNQQPPQHTTDRLQTPPYFSRWSRDKFQAAVDSGEAITLYVDNLRDAWKPMDIYRILSKYGEVIDVYVPHKRNKEINRFGFVRFRGVKDLQRLLRYVNRVLVENGVVRANLGRARQNPKARVTGPTLPRRRVSPRNSEGYNPNSINQAACGAGSRHHLYSNYRDIEMVVEVLVSFPLTDAKSQFLQQHHDWVYLWFESLQPWTVGDRATNRCCWIEVRGLPLNAWCMEFFNLIGSFFGKLVEVMEIIGNNRELEDSSVTEAVSGSVSSGEATASGAGGAQNEGVKANQRESPEIGDDPFKLMPIIARSTDMGRSTSRSVDLAKNKDVSRFSYLPFKARGSNGADFLNQPRLEANVLAPTSDDSRYNQYLENRLARAISRARVCTRKRTPKVTASGKAPSVGVSSAVNLTEVTASLRRGSSRETHSLGSHSHTPEQGRFSPHREAQLTIAVGDELGWDRGENLEQKTQMALELVEKEQ
ncbi:hypothetical protein Tsubulata_000869 [Turnera subulata]|uniref:RRM domain-containing protein n=1 Tax=Turnera subulata TaxID=218843 RepID=A0A9Q0G8I1_9ROSI|nr:hypothetical protein Tsubulata_000869 [Turnera subulata]